MTRLCRSLIFVPGNNLRFLEKSKQLTADIICFDLEDSVPEEEKQAAREMIREALKSKSSYESSIFVRTNSPQSGKIPDDLEAIVRVGVDGIVIPKVDSAIELDVIIRNLSALEEKRKLEPILVIPSIESAKGVINTYQIASSNKRIPAVVFGVFDLLSDMGIEYSKNPSGAKFSRAKIPVDASAAGVASIDAIWQDLQDAEGLEADCKIGKSLGYSGKSIIHPGQIETAHKIFRPTKAEILWAEKVSQSYLESVESGRGAIAVDGKMVDEVHFKQARALLEAAGRLDS